MIEDYVLWRAIRLLGDDASKEDRLGFLREMLASDNVGCRSAAVPAIGSLGDIASLAERFAEEENKFVREAIKAHFRGLLTTPERS